MKKSVLIVDDEPKVLQTLRHLLSSMDDDWQFEFVESGYQALQLMSIRHFHIIVSDLVMPDMDGEKLLTTVMHRYPRTTRIVLCWNADRPALPKLYGTAHQYLFKPCDPKELHETLTSVFPRNHLLTNENMVRLVSQLRNVPSMPTLYVELAREMRSEDPSLLRAGDIIAKDPGMTAKILQLVNSAFFGLRRRVASPAEAAIYLGVETIKSLVLSLQVFSQFDAAKIRACQLGGLWSHSWETAVLAKRICTTELADPRVVDYAFISGLLHDLGKLVLATNLTDLYRSALFMAANKNIPLHEAELAVFGASHAEVAGYLLGLWGLPDPIIEAVAHHHNPSQSLEQGFSPLTAVHVANILDEEKARKLGAESASLVDLNYLASVNLMDRYAVWQEVCWDALQYHPESTPAPATAALGR